MWDGKIQFEQLKLSDSQRALQSTHAKYFFALTIFPFLIVLFFIILYKNAISFFHENKFENVFSVVRNFPGVRNKYEISESLGLLPEIRVYLLFFFILNIIDDFLNVF